MFCFSSLPCGPRVGIRERHSGYRQEPPGDRGVRTARPPGDLGLAHLPPLGGWRVLEGAQGPLGLVSTQTWIPDAGTVQESRHVTSRTLQLGGGTVSEALDVIDPPERASPDVYPLCLAAPGPARH